MSDRKLPLPIKLSPELKAQFQAEAERLGRSASSHGEAVIADHLAGKSIERVLKEMEEMTAELASLRAALGNHSAAVHNLLRTVLFQVFNVDEADVRTLVDEHFAALREQYAEALTNRA